MSKKVTVSQTAPVCTHNKDAFGSSWQNGHLQQRKVAVGSLNQSIVDLFFLEQAAVFFFKWANPGLFLFIFVLFTFQFKWQIYNLNNKNWKKRRWCAWDSNPGWHDGRRRRIHWAMEAPPSMFLTFELLCFIDADDQEVRGSVPTSTPNLYFWDIEKLIFGSNHKHQNK